MLPSQSSSARRFQLAAMDLPPAGDAWARANATSARSRDRSDRGHVDLGNALVVGAARLLAELSRLLTRLTGLPRLAHLGRLPWLSRLPNLARLSRLLPRLTNLPRLARLPGLRRLADLPRLSGLTRRDAGGADGVATIHVVLDGAANLDALIDVLCELALTIARQAEHLVLGIVCARLLTELTRLTRLLSWLLSRLTRLTRLLSRLSRLSRLTRLTELAGLLLPGLLPIAIDSRGANGVVTSRQARHRKHTGIRQDVLMTRRLQVAAGLILTRLFQVLRLALYAPDQRDLLGPGLLARLLPDLPAGPGRLLALCRDSRDRQQRGGTCASGNSLQHLLLLCVMCGLVMPDLSAMRAPLFAIQTGDRARDPDAELLSRLLRIQTVSFLRDTSGARGRVRAAEVVSRYDRHATPGQSAGGSEAP